MYRRGAENGSLGDPGCRGKGTGLGVVHADEGGSVFDETDDPSKDDRWGVEESKLGDEAGVPDGVEGFLGVEADDEASESFGVVGAVLKMGRKTVEVVIRRTARSEPR